MNNFIPADYVVPEKVVTHILYNGEVTLEFREFGTPRYTVNGQEVVGVTTLLREVVPKHGLLNWAVKKTADYILTNFKHNQYYNEKQLEELVNEAKKQHRKEKEYAGDIGTGIHFYLEKYINEKMNDKVLTDIPLDIHAYAINAYKEWESKMDIQYLSSEKPVYSRKLQYAGTLDIVATVGGRKALIDIKTSNYIYPDSYFMQVAGYDIAYTEETGIELEDHYIVKLPKDTKGKFEIVKIPDIEEARTAFLHAVPLAESLYKLKHYKGV